jgi:succinate-semialdehyde dehydrogenase/glutarate-semialdehyde dehydrogenase
MTLKSVNPANGDVIAEHDVMSPTEVEGILDRCRAVQPDWAARSFADRGAVLRDVARRLRAEQDALAEEMAREMGKPLGDGRGEVEKCAWVCEYYAEHAESFLAPRPVETDARSSYVAFRPLGVVLAVMPWNFPLWQVYRFAAPTLMAGDAGLLKHASNVTGSALSIERLFREAGLPDDVFRTLRIGSDRVAGVIEHPSVAAVTLTGSTPAGRAVASKAGECLKKTVLELGGSDPYVVLEDADLERAVATCVQSRLINNGQSCIAAKRFILPASRREACEAMFVREMRARRVGDPCASDTDLGPMARRDLRDELHAQVEASVAAGARLLLGGEVPDGAGAFYPPTVLTDVGPGMPAYDDELFGPVASLIFVDDEEEAIRVANDSSFGLGAAVFTADEARGEAIARDRLHAGCCFVNGFVRSDPRLPFGGVGASGYGRELGAFGILEFVNVKTVYVA